MVLTGVPEMDTIKPIMGAITAQDNIATALLGKTRRAVLGLFMAQPERSFFLREAVRLIGAGQGAVQRELKQLSDAGILTRRRRGNQVHFQANPNCPVFPELRALILKTSGLAGRLQQALSPLAGRIAVAFVFGSLPAGAATAGSDVDVMIIGEATLREVVGALSPMQEQIGREINPTVYSVDEFREKAHSKHHFVSSVLESPRVVSDRRRG